MTLVGQGQPELLFCDNESNALRLWGVPGSTPYPKDGINDYVVGGLPTVNPAQTGTKAALRYRLTVPAGQTREVRLRLTDGDRDLGRSWDSALEVRRREADEFYTSLTPAGATQEVALVLRQALAGMLWSKQLYRYDVDRWLEGDPAY